MIIGHKFVRQLWIGHCTTKTWKLNSETVKPWPNGLASRLNFWTCVSFGHPLATTCVDFGRAQIWTQVDASFFLPFGHPAQVDTSWYQLYAWNVRLFATCEPTCESVWPPFASPYASPGFANLRWLASTCESVCPGLKITDFKFSHLTKIISINKIICNCNCTNSWLSNAWQRLQVLWL